MDIDGGNDAERALTAIWGVENPDVDRVALRKRSLTVHVHGRTAAALTRTDDLRRDLDAAATSARMTHAHLALLAHEGESHTSYAPLIAAAVVVFVVWAF